MEKKKKKGGGGWLPACLWWGGGGGGGRILVLIPLTVTNVCWLRRAKSPTMSLNRTKTGLPLPFRVRCGWQIKGVGSGCDSDVDKLRPREAVATAQQPDNTGQAAGGGAAQRRSRQWGAGCTCSGLDEGGERRRSWRRSENWPKGFRIKTLQPARPVFVVTLEFKFKVALRPQRPCRLLGTGSPGRPPRLSHSSWVLHTVLLRFIVALRPQTIVQELCESRGGRPGLSVLTSLLVSVDVKLYWTMLRHWSQLVPNMSTDVRGH